MDYLDKSDLQYQITWNDANCFGIGERVFLKSNPNVVLTVISVDEKENNVLVRWNGNMGRYHLDRFTPECILQYMFAGLVYWKGNKMCLN